MWQDILNRYGSRCADGEARVYIYITDPAKLDTADRIIHRDRAAAQSIAEMEKYIEDLKEYRRALAARYAELETMTYILELELKRCPYWKGGITYEINIYRRYSDGCTVSDLREVYPGSERHKAFKRFEELKKSRPGITITVDTAKKHWER